VALPLQVASAAERPGMVERRGPVDAQAGAEALRQQREQEALRQSLSGEAQSRATEDRGRAMQQRIDEIVRGARPTSRY